MEPLRTHVRKILRGSAADSAAETDRIRKLEEAGRRIITGGQIGEDEWDVIDWRTRETIATGGGGLDGYDAAAARLDPEKRWYHIDAIWNDVETSEVSPTEGIPPSLGDALEEWIGSTAAPDEEIAQVAGWTVDEVRACRN